jgi:hypothetical protein
MILLVQGWRLAEGPSREGSSGVFDIDLGVVANAEREQL